MITIIYKFIRAAAYLIGGDYKAISFVAITLIATMLAHYKEKIKACVPKMAYNLIPGAFILASILIEKEYTGWTIVLIVVTGLECHLVWMYDEYRYIYAGKFAIEFTFMIYAYANGMIFAGIIETVAVIFNFIMYGAEMNIIKLSVKK